MEMLETLLEGVRSACAAFPDKRRGDVTYSMADIGLSDFSLFFMQSASFLAYQRALEEGRKMSNCQSLFGMTAVPTDNHIRAMLDPVHPSHLQPAFDQILDTLRRHGRLLAGVVQNLPFLGYTGVRRPWPVRVGFRLSSTLAIRRRGKARM